MSLFPLVFLRSIAVAGCLYSVAIAADDKKSVSPIAKEEEAKGKEMPDTGSPPAVEDDDLTAEKIEADDTAKVARPVTSDPVQVYGWREKIKLAELTEQLTAKLDTCATTSSLHAENEQIFERDGKKWVKFVCTDPRQAGAKRYELEAPLVRTVNIKEPGEKSERRNVVRLTFTIGDRKVKADFSLNDRHNMLCPVLIGRSTIAILGWVDPSRTFMADDKIMR